MKNSAVRFLGLMVLCAVTLSGCQTLSIEQCQQGNWYERGRDDGLQGRAPRSSQLARECSVQRVQVPDTAFTTYRQGHAAGLAVYCTPPVLLEKSLRSDVSLALCPTAQVPALTPFAQVGANFRHNQRRLEQLRDERARLLRDLDSRPPLPDASRRNVILKLRQLDRDIQMLQYRLEKDDTDVRYWRQRAQQAIH